MMKLGDHIDTAALIKTISVDLTRNLSKSWKGVTRTLELTSL